ncbi:hypothetical protein Rhe02_83550 [Rhizocola hellebori]|uniref:Uncharacterized protein n=1 Tax=Rhizocola hellebori TaxID=1392758 RepID=A0A8J3VLL7_9ACTN|nr:hypothetical protein [Rhizocola hellebori]GIH10288.1 hypothetical protein Rhe02_83550 [Rhizocola hellebori]
MDVRNEVRHGQKVIDRPLRDKDLSELADGLLDGTIDEDSYYEELDRRTPEMLELLSRSFDK